MVTVDQHALAFNGVCYRAMPVNTSKESPDVSACDGDDGQLDGTRNLSGIPPNVPYQLIPAAMPPTCSFDGPFLTFQQADATVLTERMSCLSTGVTALPATGIGPIGAASQAFFALPLFALLLAALAWLLAVASARATLIQETS